MTRLSGSTRPERRRGGYAARIASSLRIPCPASPWSFKICTTRRAWTDCRPRRAAQRGGRMYPERFPRNQWYVGAHSEELGQELLSRWLLDEPVVFYRAEDGRPVALADACAHRQFPLSQSRR